MAITNKTDNDWLTDVQLETSKPTIVLFGSLADIGETPTIPQDRTAEAYEQFDVAESIVNENSEEIKFFYADSDVAQSAANISSIGSQPTTVLYKRGIEIKRYYGNDIADDIVQDFSDIFVPDLTQTLAFDGDVLAIASDGSGGWYVGGDFTKVTDTPDVRGSFVANSISMSTISPYTSFFVDGVVHAIISDGSGGYIIGGEFNTFNKSPRKNLARINSSQELQDWNPQANGPVYALAVYGSDVIVGGDFTTLGGNSRQNIGAVPLTSDEATNWNPGANNIVRTLDILSTYILVGGDFTTLGGLPRNHIGSVPNNSDTATSWNPDVDGSVRTIAVHYSTGDVFFGGTFFNVGFDSRNHLASTGVYPSDIATSWDPNASGPVYSLNVAWDGVSSYYLIAGGDFATFDTQTLGNVAKVDLSTMTTDATWNPDTNGPVYAVASSQNYILIGGDFDVGGGGPAPNYLVNTLNSDVSFPTDADAYVNDKVRAGLFTAGGFLVGGEFCGTQWTPRQRLAHIIPTVAPYYFMLDPAWTPTADAKVLAIETYGTNVIIGGWFLNINGTPKQYLSAVDDTGALIYSNMDCDDIVTVMKKYNDLLFVGGNFSSVEGNSLTRLAKFYLADLSLGPETIWNPGCDGPPLAMGFVESQDISDPIHLVVGGTFTTLGGAVRNYLGSVSIVNGLTVPAESWDPNAGDVVNSVAIKDDTVFVGGEFTALNGETRSYLGAYTYGNNTPLASWKPAANDHVTTMFANAKDVFYGGKFTSVSTNSRNFAASSPVTTGSINAWNPGVDSFVKNICVSSAYAAIGGIFWKANSTEAEAITAPVCRYFTIAKIA